MSRPIAGHTEAPGAPTVHDELKAGVVRLALEDGKTVGALTREMDLTETAVREWIKRARIARTATPA